MAVFEPDCARVLWLGVELYYGTLLGDKFVTSKNPLNAEVHSTRK